MSKKFFYDGTNNSGHYNFVMVDRELVMCVDDRDRNIPSCLRLSLPALGMYVVLKAHAINKNFSWPSLETLEKITGADHKTIQKHIRELAEKGLVEVKPIPNPIGKGRPVNSYTINSVDKEGVRERSLREKLPFNPAD